MTRRTFLVILLIAYLIFLFDIALFRFPAKNPAVNLVPLRSILHDWHSGGWPFVINFVGNIVAFVPMGLILPCVRRRPTALWHAAIFSLALSLMIEAGQLVSGRRVPDVDDLILNMFGGAIGYLLSGQWPSAKTSTAQSRADLK